MPTVITRGAASAQGYGFAARSAAANYIEDVFSTYLYTGNGSTQTITNGIDLAGKGGLVWNKWRSGVLGSGDNALWDTARGSNQKLISNTTDANINQPNGVSFDATGFTMGASGNNNNGALFTSWTFRKQAKFFDVVTYTGNGANRTIAHNLGAAPGCIIVKRTDSVADWAVYHRGTGAGRLNWAKLNTTAAFSAESTIWNDTSPTSTDFSLGTATAVNASGGTYVAYLFAHDAGGFGAAGTDNVISCGSFTTDGSGNATVTLGYEPQWCMFKRAVGGTGNWTILDNMRGWVVGGNDNQLQANLSSAETSASNLSDPNATGFSVAGISASSTYIYIAIRRGPMKTPTSGTSVFSSLLTTSSSTVNPGFPADLAINGIRAGSSYAQAVGSRLQGADLLKTSQTDAALDVFGNWCDFTKQNSFSQSLFTAVSWLFRRAPGFFDIVCYTGTNANRTLNHNLGVIPELIIVKDRSQAQDWEVYSAATGAANALRLNQTVASFAASTYWNNTAPTSSVFTVGTSSDVNSNGNSYVAYLFATLAGISKVGSYTGTGTTKQIDCGFTGGARFVLIKQTNAGTTGDWYVWDSTRGIVAGNDPYLLLNSMAAEVTNTDYIDTYSAGFEISSTAPAAINANGGSFIYLAIA